MLNRNLCYRTQKLEILAMKSGIVEYLVKNLQVFFLVDIELVALKSEASIFDQEILSSCICSHHHTYYLRKFSKLVSRIGGDVFEIYPGKDQWSHIKLYLILLTCSWPYFLASYLARSYVQLTGRSLNCSRIQVLQQENCQWHLQVSHFRFVEKSVSQSKISKY